MGKLKSPCVKQHELSDDPTEGPSKKISFQHQIGQLARYMQELDVKYGFYTTYDQFVFLKQQFVRGRWELHYRVKPTQARPQPQPSCSHWGISVSWLSGPRCFRVKGRPQRPFTISRRGSSTSLLNPGFRVVIEVWKDCPFDTQHDTCDNEITRVAPRSGPGRGPNETSVSAADWERFDNPVPLSTTWTTPTRSRFGNLRARAYSRY